MSIDVEAHDQNGTEFSEVESKEFASSSKPEGNIYVVKTHEPTPTREGSLGNTASVSQLNLVEGDQGNPLSQLKQVRCNSII